jgi:MFS family permease
LRYDPPLESAAHGGATGAGIEMTARTATLRGDVRVIGLVATGHFFSHFYMLVLPPLFPILKAEFGVSYTALGALVTAFAVSSGVLQVPVGFAVDRIGARFVLIGGLATLAGGVTLMGFTSTYWSLFLLALIAGLGNSVFHPSDYSILSASVDGRRLGRAFGIHTFAGNAGWALAPPLMIALTSLWHWRLALSAVGALGLVVALALLSQRRHLEGDSRRAGAAPAPGGVPTPSAFTLLFSLPILLLFSFFVMIAMTMGGIQSFSVTGLVHLHGIPLTSANAALTAFLVAGAVGVLVGGVIADRTERYDVVATVGFLVAATMFVLVGSTEMSVIWMGAGFAIAGLMQGIIWPSRDMMVRALTPPGSSGKVFGFVSTGLDVGGALSPVLFGWIIDRGAPEGIFWLTALFMVTSLAAALGAARLARRLRPAYAAE